MSEVTDYQIRPLGPNGPSAVPPGSSQRVSTASAETSKASKVRSMFPTIGCRTRFVPVCSADEHCERPKGRTKRDLRQLDQPEPCVNCLMARRLRSRTKHRGGDRLRPKSRRRTGSRKYGHQTIHHVGRDRRSCTLLAGDSATNITGEDITIDGGLTQSL